MGQSRRRVAFIALAVSLGLMAAAGIAELVAYGLLSSDNRLSISFDWHPLAPERLGTVADKRPGTTRILVVGDSVAFGNDLAEAEALPAQLERVLKQLKTDWDVEVLNASIPGASSHAQIQHMQSEYLSFNPDIVIFALGWNDLYNWFWLGEEWERAETDHQAVHTIHGSSLAELARRSYFIRLVYSKMRFWAFERNFRTLCVDGLTSPFEPVVLALARNLEVMTGQAQAAGASVYVLRLPFLLDTARLGEEYRELEAAPEGTSLFRGFEVLRDARYFPIRQLHEAMVLACSATGAQLIDGASAFQEIPVQQRKHLFIDPIHFSPAGSRMEAELVATELLGHHTNP